MIEFDQPPRAKTFVSQFIVLNMRNRNLHHGALIKYCLRTYPGQNPCQVLSPELQYVLTFLLEPIFDEVEFVECIAAYWFYDSSPSISCRRGPLAGALKRQQSLCIQNAI